MRGHTGDELLRLPVRAHGSAWAGPSTSSCIRASLGARARRALRGRAPPLPAVSAASLAEGAIEAGRPSSCSTGTRFVYRARGALPRRAAGASVGADGSTLEDVVLGPDVGDRGARARASRSPPTGALDGIVLPVRRAHAVAEAGAGWYARAPMAFSRSKLLPHARGRALSRPHNWVQLAKFAPSGRAATRSTWSSTRRSCAARTSTT